MKRRLKSSRERSFNNLITGLATLCGWVIVGTVGYRFLEKWTWFDSLYMTILSLSTVGFREVHNLSQSGRIFTLILIVGGLSTAAYSLSVIGQWVFEGKIREALGRTRMRKELNNLQGHRIVCGYGRMGKFVTQLLREEGETVVVIDRDESHEAELHDHGIPHLIGDATDEEILEGASISRAASMMALLPSDPENVYLTLTAKSLNPTILVVSRISHESARSKLLRAGVDSVIFPFQTAAVRAVNAILRPNVGEWVEVVSGKGGQPLNLEEIVLNTGSTFIGKTLSESDVRRSFKANVLAIRRRGTPMIINPEPDEIFQESDVIVAIGDPDGLNRLAERCAG